MPTKALPRVARLRDDDLLDFDLTALGGFERGPRARYPGKKFVLEVYQAA